MEKITTNFNHSYNDVIKEIKNQIYLGVENPKVLKIVNQANQIENQNEKEKFIFDSVYDLAVFRTTPSDRQQLRSAANIIRNKKANCTGYTTLIGSILENLKIPYTLRLVDTDGRGFNHIYVKTNNNVLDCIISQKQDDTEVFGNRIEGLFNYEVNYLTKKDFPMVTVINGRISRNRINNRNLNGIYDSIFGLLLGDECNLTCNMKYASDEVMRKKCKEACAMNMTMSQYDNWLAGGGSVTSVPYVSNPNQMSDTTKMMIYGGIGLGALYLFTRKK